MSAQVAAVGAADREPAVGAAVDGRVDRLVRSARDDDRCLAHVGLDEVARVPDLRLVAEEQPGAAEDAALLELVDLGVAPGPAADEGGVVVHDVADLLLHDALRGGGQEIIR